MPHRFAPLIGYFPPDDEAFVAAVRLAFESEVGRTPLHWLRKAVEATVRHDYPDASIVEEQRMSGGGRELWTAYRDGAPG